MGRILASFVVAVSLLSVASSEASAWVCFATGLGSGGWGRSYSIIDAKLLALRRCEHYSTALATPEVIVDRYSRFPNLI